jgi:uncharacterized glyoxalase superfamily protein PhnB
MRASPMFRRAVPILGVSKSAEAEAFYCIKLGFRREFAYRPAPDRLDPCYMGIGRDDAHMVISSFPPDGPPGSRTVQIFVENVAALREELAGAGVAPLTAIVDQEWGTLDLGIRDPDGNGITFSQLKAR